MVRFDDNYIGASSTAKYRYVEITPEIRVCPECSGTGHVERNIKWDRKGVERRKLKCNHCLGKGEIIHIPKKYKGYVIDYGD